MTAIRVGRPVSRVRLRSRARTRSSICARGCGSPICIPSMRWHETLNMLARCAFSLDELRYEYPDELVPPGFTHAAYLRQETYIGAHRRFPSGIPHEVQEQIEHELELIARAGIRAVFPDGLRHRALRAQPSTFCARAAARRPTRRSAIASASPKSIPRAATCCSSVSFQQGARRAAGHRRRLRAPAARRSHPVHLPQVRPRPRGDCGRRVHLSAARRAARDAARRSASTRRSSTRWPSRISGSTTASDLLKRFAESGLDPENPLIQAWASLAVATAGFSAPSVAALWRLRHQPRQALAAGAGRKCGDGGPQRDPVGQGRPRSARAAESRRARAGHAVGHPAHARHRVASSAASASRCRTFRPRTAPTYEMICAGRHRRRVPDRIARADEHAAAPAAAQVLRPGDRSGDRAAGADPGRRGSSLPAPAAGTRTRHLSERRLEEALERTLGVPIFQEQVMQVAMLAAGFTAGEADQLRRAMAAWKRKGGLEKYYDRIVNGMTGARLRAGLRRRHLRADQGLRRVRLSGEPRGEFRAARLCEQLAEMPRAGGVSCRHAQQPADGLLFALATRAGCEAPRRRGAAGRRHGQRLGLGAGTGRTMASARRAARLVAAARHARRRRGTHRERRAPSGRSRTSLISRGARNWTATTCRCWPQPTRWPRSPATVARRLWQSVAAVPDKDMLAAAQVEDETPRARRAVGSRRHRRRLQVDRA